ncbi:MAG: helix-turn-helix domain-containing protein [Flavisolibacter sp.]
MSTTTAMDTENRLFSLAADIINHTDKNLFLTGKAGTGKTTFLKHIRENCPKQMAVVAPTGVAAINAGGVTIHSFFQLPFAPFLPESRGFSGGEESLNRHNLAARVRLNSERRKIIRELELLVIDEISMVRCDVLDAMDTLLRSIRHNYHEKFGGVQVLFIGDLYQLPPVAKEWEVLSDHYDSPFFFDSRVLKDEPPVCLEFTKIYRQSDPVFIDLLNRVRHNELTEESLQLLESRFDPALSSEAKDGYIILSTHNETARQINAAELSKINSKPFVYKAETEGVFSENALPADAELQLKVGAQVMFLKNDLDKAKRYFNGKIGVVKKLENDCIEVSCRDADGAEDIIEVKQDTWENIRYTLNKSTRQVDEEKLGSFKQYPLRLAWAITIHKSQGLTFQKAIIDAAAAFSPGQVYVALSRCTNLDGLVLRSRLRRQSLQVDSRVVAFSEKQVNETQLTVLFEEAKANYRRKVTYSLFDFSEAIQLGKELQEVLLKNSGSFRQESFGWSEELLKQVDLVQETAKKFHRQLDAFFAEERPEENLQLQERIRKAVIYFSGEIEKLQLLLKELPVQTDSHQLAKEFNDQLKELFVHLSQKHYLLQGFSGKFDMERYHRRKNSFAVPAFGVNVWSGSASSLSKNREHPALYQMLKSERDEICRERSVPIYMVLSTRALDEMCHYLPQTLKELEQISGFGAVKIKSYGQRFLEIIQSYSSEQGLESRMGEKPSRSKTKKSSSAKKLPTRDISLQLFKEGKSIAEIAKERNLAASTIEGHLATFVASGELHIDELVDKAKQELIRSIIKSPEERTLSELMQALNHQVSFGELRLMMNWLNRFEDN